MVGHPPYPCLVEQVGREDEAAEVAGLPLLGVQFEVEPGGLVGDVDDFRGHLPDLPGALEVQVVAQDLEQRVDPGVAPGRDLLHDPREGRFLVVLRFEGDVPGAAQEFREGGGAREVRAQGDGVHEEPDGVFEFRAGPVGDRCADDDVPLARVAVEHGVERRQQDHEGRDPFAAAQLVQFPREVRGHVHGDRGAAEAGDGGPRPVGGQVHDGQVPAQPVLPVADLAFDVGGGARAVLPHRVVGVLQGHVGQACVPVERPPPRTGSTAPGRRSPRTSRR